MKQKNLKIFIALAIIFGSLSLSQSVKADEDDIKDGIESLTEELGDLEKLKDITSITDGQLGGLVDGELGNIVNDQLGNIVNDQLGNIVNDQLGDVVDGELGNLIGGNLPDLLNGDIKGIIASISSKIMPNLLSKIGSILPAELSESLGEELQGAVGELGIIDFDKVDKEKSKDPDGKPKKPPGYSDELWDSFVKSEQRKNIAGSTLGDDGQKELNQKLETIQKGAEASAQSAEDSSNAQKEVEKLSDESKKSSESIGKACEQDSLKISQDLLKCNIKQNKEFAKQYANLAEQNQQLSTQFSKNSEQLKNVTEQLATINDTLVKQKVIQTSQAVSLVEIERTQKGKVEEEQMGYTQDHMWAAGQLFRGIYLFNLFDNDNSSGENSSDDD